MTLSCVVTSVISTDPPPGISDAVIDRVRRDEWRAEQMLDWAFNVGIAVGVVLIIAGAIGLLWTV